MNSVILFVLALLIGFAIGFRFRRRVEDKRFWMICHIADYWHRAYCDLFTHVKDHGTENPEDAADWWKKQ